MLPYKMLDAEVNQEFDVAQTHRYSPGLKKQGEQEFLYNTCMLTCISHESKVGFIGHVDSWFV